MAYRYRTFARDGNDAGGILLSILVNPGAGLHLGPGRRLRVLEVVAIMETDSPFLGLLTVEPVE